MDFRAHPILAIVFCAFSAGAAFAQNAEPGWGPYRLGMTAHDAASIRPELMGAVSASGSGLMLGDGPVIDGQPFTVALSVSDGNAERVTFHAEYPLSPAEDCAARYPVLLREATRELGALDAVIGESSFLLHVPPPGESPPAEADATPALITTADGLSYYRFDIPAYRQVVLLNRASHGRIALILNSRLNAENPAGLPICEARIELRRGP